MKKLIWAFLLTASSWTYAGLEEGFAAFQKGEDGRALKEYKPLAEEGNAKAQYYLGDLYLFSQNYQDYREALYWYQKAAEQGHTGAQVALANMYRAGRGVPQNYSQAMPWYQKAAEQGHTGAQIALADMYYDGKGVPQNYSHAVYWVQKAAEQGHTGAQLNLAFMYCDGKGVPQNNEIAYILFSLSETEDQHFEKNPRDLVLAKLSPEAIKDAKRITIKLQKSKNLAVDLKKLIDSTE